MKYMLSRRLFDPLNSACWFLMDVSWAAQMPMAAYPLMALTVITGAALLAAEHQRQMLYVNLGLNCWIWLNTLWMLSDLRHLEPLRYAGLGSAGLGLVFLGVGIFRSGDIQETMQFFKRLRLVRRRDGA